MSGVKKVVDGAAKAGKAIDWDGMTKFSQGFCASHRIDDAFELLSQMESDVCRPNAHTLTVLIHGLCKEKRLADAEVLLSESFGRGSY